MRRQGKRRQPDYSHARPPHARSLFPRPLCVQGLLSPVVQGVMGLGQYHSPRPEALAKSRSAQGTISVTAMGGLA